MSVLEIASNIRCSTIVRMRKRARSRGGHSKILRLQRFRGAVCISQLIPSVETDPAGTPTEANGAMLWSVTENSASVSLVPHQRYS